MGTPLVEIVPNFSEGRREDVIEDIVRACLVPGVRLLARQADPDHNRLDLSLAGPPEAVRRSALAGAARAAALIDMTQHRGSHPRMGAVDVIPFIPVRDVTMDECVALARDVAREIGESLGIPAYCYEQAAFTPERRSLADVRRGEYEGLQADVAAGRRLPDFGPEAIGTAGAVAVGARAPLIAFNVYLSGTDEAAAKAVARAVRESSGGLRNVRAIGFAVPDRGCVEVSMNLIDPEATPAHRALELVRREAARYGMRVLSTEIVGLVPERALADDAAFYLQIEGFDPDAQVLERRLAAAETGAGAGAEIGASAVGGFLEALASGDPTPGGGSAAAVAAAAGAALLAMVARLTVGKAGYEDVSERMAAALDVADAGRGDLLALADDDARAFRAVLEAYRLPKDDEARAEAIRRALTDAAAVPLTVARRTVALLERVAWAAAAGNVQAASDGVSAAELLAAGARAALHNVETNLASLREPDPALGSEADALRARADELLAATRDAFAARTSPG